MPNAVPGLDAMPLTSTSALQKMYQLVPELEKSTAVAVEKMRLEEAARRKLEERLISVSPLFACDALCAALPRVACN